MTKRKPSDSPEYLNGPIIDWPNEGDKRYFQLSDLFNWIKDEAQNEGLTVEIKGDKMMFIKGKK